VRTKENFDGFEILAVNKIVHSENFKPVEILPRKKRALDQKAPNLGRIRDKKVHLWSESAPPTSRHLWNMPLKSGFKFSSSSFEFFSQKEEKKNLNPEFGRCCFGVSGVDR